MQLAEIQNELSGFIKQNILNEGVEVENETILSEIGIDSYSIVEIILFIERKFYVILKDEQLVPENFETVTRISDLITIELE